MIFFQIFSIDFGVLIQKPVGFTNVLNVPIIIIVHVDKYVMNFIVLIRVLLKVPLITE